MGDHNPRLLAGSPVEVVAARTLFRSASVRQHDFGSLACLDNGRLLLAFRLGTGPIRRNDGAVMLTRSDDGGVTWTDPMPLSAHPGWDCLLLGGLARLSDDRIRLILGRVKLDFGLGGPEPLSKWHAAAIESRDGGETWRFVGHLYAGDAAFTAVPGSPCGYPDIVSVGRDESVCVLHTYPDADGRVDLHLLRLRDRS